MLDFTKYFLHASDFIIVSLTLDKLDLTCK